MRFIGNTISAVSGRIFGSGGLLEKASPLINIAI